MPKTETKKYNIIHIPLIKNILLLFFAIIVSVSFLEAINFIYERHNQYYYVWPPGLNRTFLPDEDVFSGIKGPSIFTINKLGYRGPLIENKNKEYRVLAIGGSTTECLYLDNEESWPFLLMKKLNLTNSGQKVISMNIGKSGHNSRDHIFELKYLTEYYDPDLIIIMVGANDMLLKLSKRWVWKPFNETSYDLSKTFYYSQNFNWKSTLLYKIYKIIYNKFYLKINPQDEVGQTYLESRTERKNGQTFIELPNLDETLADYEKNLHRLVEISRQKNKTILFLTQPFLWKNEMSEQEDNVLWMTTDFNGNYYNVESMALSMNLFNNRLLAVCKEYELDKEPNIFCFDLEEEIPKNLAYFYDDMHFNEGGAEASAEKISLFIKNNIDNFK